MSHSSLIRNLVLLTLAGVATATTAAEVLTLDRAVDLARQQNPELLALRQEMDIARASLKKARYWNQFNPEIEGGAGNRRFDDGGSDVQSSASLSIEVEVGGQRGQRVNEAECNLTRTEAEVADAERVLVAQVQEAFYRVLYLRRRLAFYREIEELNRRLRDAAIERHRSGETSKVEANLAVVRHSQSRKDTLTAGRDCENGVRELERLVGAEPTGATELSGDLQAAPVSVNVDELIEAALRLRPDLRARKAEIERLDAETALTRRLIIPNPKLSALYEEEVETEGSRDRIIGGGVSIPLPVFDRKQSELAALASQRVRAGHERAGAILSVKAEVRDAYRGYEAAREAVRVLEADAMESISENFRFIEFAYRQGKIDLLQLIVVQNDLVTTQFSYVDSLWEYWLARIALGRAVGEPLEGRRR